MLDEGAATVCDSCVELVERFEIAIGERLVDEGPQMLRRLQFGTVGRLEDEADAVGNGKVLRSMPTGVVELQHDPLVLAGADRRGEIGQHEFEQRLADSIRNIPYGRASRRLDKACHVEPFEAMMPERDRSLADGRPHAARDRLQADAVFIRRPDLDLGVGMLFALLRDGVLKFFLCSARSASPAASGWRGRGCWIE